MGRPESAPCCTTGTDRPDPDRSRPRPRPERPAVSVFSTGSILALVLAAPGDAQEFRQASDAPSALPSLLRPRVESLLLEGDTLAAMDLLQDPAQRQDSNDWADSLLDELVLPGDNDPAPARRRSTWVARFDGGHLGSRTSSGTTSATILTDRVLRIQDEHLVQALRGGVRWHALRGEFLSTIGIEPQVSWSAQTGKHSGSLRGWALWTQELGNDAGLDLVVRTQVHPSLWTGFEGATSLEATQTAQIGLGTERRVGGWTLSGSLRTGWKRLIPLDPDTTRIVRIDSLTGDFAWLDESLLSPQEAADLPGEVLESTTPDRWILSARCLAVHSWGDFQVGPGFEMEGLRSVRSERWLPDSRTTFVSGTPILLPGNQPGRAIALLPKQPLGFDLVEVEPIRSGRLLTLLSTPTVQGSWRPRGKAWSVEGLLAWNIPYASEPGHPLAEDRDGLEARVGSEIRW